MPDVELSVRQAARVLSVSERTVRRWLADGRLVGRREVLGGVTVWHVSEDSARHLKMSGEGQSIASGEVADKVAVDLLDEVRSLRQENAEYRAHLERLTVAVDTLTRSLPPAQEERMRLERSLQDTTAAINDLRKTAEAQREENERLRAELAEQRRPWWRRLFT